MNALVIEDHPLYRDALTRLLMPLMGDGVVHAAESAEHGLQIADQQLDMGLILLDMDLPGMQGLEALEALKAQCPNAALFVVSGSVDRREIEQVLRIGARAFLSKDIPADTMLSTLRSFLTDPMAQPQWITAQGSNTLYDTPTPNAMSKLTVRQRDVLLLVCKGLSNKDIAYRLELSEITVKQHLSVVFKRLGVVNRTQAVLAAKRYSN